MYKSTRTHSMVVFLLYIFVRPYSSIYGVCVCISMRCIASAQMKAHFYLSAFLTWFVHFPNFHYSFSVIVSCYCLLFGRVDAARCRVCARAKNLPCAYIYILVFVHFLVLNFMSYMNEWMYIRDVHAKDTLTYIYCYTAWCAVWFYSRIQSANIALTHTHTHMRC